MSKVTPRDREEKLLAAIAEGATGELPTPRNRKEKLLKEIYDNGGTGGGGGESTIAWRPTVDAEGNISWERTASTVKPATQNIKGPRGEKGDPGEANVIESISVNGTPTSIDENKNVDITVPEAYDDTDIRTELAKKADATSIPSKVSELTNDSNYQTAEQVNSTVTTEIAKVVAGAPEDFDTLKEMSDWISSHESSASAMNTQIQNNKEAISGHVSNADVHFTSEERTKLKGVEVNANKTVVDDKISDTSVNPVQNKVINAKVKEIESNVSGNTEKINSLETEVSNLPEWSKSATKPTYTKEEVGLGNVDNTADADKSVKYATSAGSAANATNATKVNNHTVNADVPANAEFTDTTYNDATTSSRGLMTTTMVSKLNGIAEGANKTTVDTALSPTSTNPVQNKVVNAAIVKKADVFKYQFSNHNEYRCLGTATLKQEGDYLILHIYCGDGYNAGIYQDRTIDVHIRTSNGIAADGQYYIGYIESHLNGAKNCNVYVVQNSSTSFTIWIGKLNHSGRSFYEVQFPSGDSWVPAANTSTTIPTNGVALIEKEIAYTDVVNAAIAKKADTISYDKSASTLYLKSGSTVLSSTVIKSGGGATITPKPTVNPQIKNDDKKVVITWEDPTDTVIEGSTFSKWAGTKLVMKESGYPTSPDDGTVLVDNTTRDKYKTTGFTKDGLTNDKQYYFALFPYSTDGVYNYDSGNRLLGEPTELKIVTFSGGANKTTVDTALSSTSTNPVQNKVVTSNLTDIRKETTVNLLNPTLETTTQDGVTCTNNGDGTYTLNGTATSTVRFQFGIDDNLIVGKTYKALGIPISGSFSTVLMGWDCHGYFNKDGLIDKKTSEPRPISIQVLSGYTCDNLVFKPMLTTNLSATYDDFVPYTGDGETLASDVAELRKDLGGLTFSASGTTLTITDGTNTWTLEANS